MMNEVRRIVGGLVVCLLLFFVNTASAAGFRVAVVTDGPGPMTDTYVRGVGRELERLFEGTGTVELVRDPAFNGDWTMQGAENALRAAVGRRNLSMVLCAGILSSAAAARMETPAPVPVIGGRGLDGDLFELRDLPPGKNFNLIPASGHIRSDLRHIAALFGSERILFLADGNLIRELPESVKRLQRLGLESGLSITVQPAGATVQETMPALPEQIGAVYVGPLPQLDTEARSALYAALHERGVPTYSFLGREETVLGAMAGGFSDLSLRLHRRVALNMQRILDGARPDKLPGRLPADSELYLNREAMRAAGYSPPVSVLMTARMVGDVPGEDAGAELSLEEAMRLAAKRSLSVRVDARATEAAEHQGRRVAGAFLPQVEGNMVYSQIDQDRSSAQFGMYPWQRTAAGITVGQVLFDDSIITRYKQARVMVKSAALDERSGRLDVMLQAGLAYLNVLSSRALLGIERENVDLTQENLELARVRRSVGVSGPEDVLRWETLLAQSRSRLIRREADLRTAWLSFNLVLHMDPQTRWNLKQVDNAAAEQGFLDGALVNAVHTLKDLDLIRKFSLSRVEESPAVASLQQKIEAQRLELQRVTRSFYLPKVVGQLTYDHELDVHRTGTVAIYEDSYPASTDAWSVGVKMTLPLYSGGSRFAEKSEARTMLEKYRLQLDQLREMMSQETLARINDLYHSWPNIELTAIGADRARKNLEVVREKYGAGEVSILSLLDAQNQAMAQEQSASLAVYGFMADLLRYQRAISWMQADRSEEERQEFGRVLLGAVAGTGG